MLWKQHGKSFRAVLPETIPIALVAGHCTDGSYMACAYCGTNLVYAQESSDATEAKKLLDQWIKQLHENLTKALG